MTSSEEPRVEQAWQGRSGDNWVAFEAALDAQLDPFGRAVLDKVAPRRGEWALDIGCGTGQTLIELAELVGREGRVLGVDLSEPMLARARQRLQSAGLGPDRVELALGDAAAYAFEPRFDLAFSRFGVMFFENSARAFRNVANALRPGGRLGFACWQALSKNQWASVGLDAVLPRLPSGEPPALLRDDRPGPFYFSDAERVRGFLKQAGFVDVEIEAVEREVHVGAAQTSEQAADYALEIGPASRAIEGSDPALRPALRDALVAAFRPFVSERGVWLGAAAFVVTAVRP